LNNFFSTHEIYGDILFLLVYPWSPQIFSSFGIFVIRNVYFDRTIIAANDCDVNLHFFSY
jgi:hypothetical protein